MGILGKDLFDCNYNLLEFTALFSNGMIIIEDNNYRHGELVTDFLNYDISDFALAVRALKIFCSDKQENSYNTVEKKIIKMIFSMPLFREFNYRKAWLEIKKSSSPYANLDDYVKLYSDLLLMERYRWFIKEMFYRTKWKVNTNKFADLIENNGVGAFTSGVSLGENGFVDAPNLSVQYEVRKADDGTIKIYEKMKFTNLISFLYVDLFKAIMNNYCPKSCRLCGNFFLQEPGLAFEYCQNAAPDESVKTCRDIGSRKSFKDKIKNNPVWEIHQRAYKKYYARMKKKKMSEQDFAQWTIEAEKLRDDMLIFYERDNTVNLEEYTMKMNGF